MTAYAVTLGVILQVSLVGQPNRTGYALEGTLGIATPLGPSGTTFTVQIPSPAGTWTAIANLFELEIDPTPITI